ncbi:MAG: hypothetical protein NTW02_07020 [Cyanobium sp. LacPavin_0920_WC12_MAG_62_9]|nr:hypothetical protein [Cyanobium sp. LacPavin_0920_WC12_MAG_62_9]
MPTTLPDAADAFYAAANLMLAGDLSGLQSIWSEADDISQLGPTGAICIGRAAVMEQFAKEAAIPPRSFARRLAIGVCSITTPIAST